ncbi:MAG: bifunctional folylpolyglutamate synthase/dihydrofolate synthase [Flavobacteriales bacterium]
MNYQETVKWMFSQLPMYQNVGKSAYKENIGNIVLACEYLEQPHTKFKSVHIAGTNGKGSTSHMIASVLQEAGYKVGLYTSPHLKDFRERIRINGDKINEDYVVNFIFHHQSFFEKIKASFFEMTVALAFDYFANSKVDIAIIETGLGGRLDSTNIITPILSVITNVSYDHSNLLGNTITSIANEKAGIIKDQIPVIIGRKQKDTESIFELKAKQHKSPLIYAKKYSNQSDLKGLYQHENINTCVECCIYLNKIGFNISNSNIDLGLKNVSKNTRLRGRWEKLSTKPLVICDTGHNIEGINEIVKQINTLEFDSLHFVLGMVKDKNINEILSILPKNATYYFCSPNIERALDVIHLQEMAKNIGLFGKKYESVSIAYQRAIKNCKINDLVFIGGSTFVVSEIL